MTKVDLHKVLVIYIASTKSMPVTWGLFWIFVFYLSSILTIIGFLFQLSHLFNSNHIVFSKNSRKATLGKITRSSPLFSKFYNSVSFVDEGVKLKPLFFRTNWFVLTSMVYLILVFIFRVTQGIVIGILLLLLSSLGSLFLILCYDFVDGFSQFLLTEHRKYIFTVLKPQIQKFSVILRQDLFLITFVWFYLFIGILIIGPSNFLSFVTSNPIVPVSLLGIGLLISVFLTHEFNDKKDYLVSWAFEKYREEEDLRLPVRIEIIDKNGFKEVISGFLQGINQNIAILLDDGMIQEIPWKKICNIIIGVGSILRQEKCTTMQQFFDDLIGKSLTIYNKLKVTKYMITSFPNPFKRIIRKLGENITEYFDERTGPQVMEFFLHSWEIVKEHDHRVLCLDLSSEIGNPHLLRLKVSEKIDLVIRTDSGTSFKVLNYDLREKTVTFKEIPYSGTV